MKKMQRILLIDDDETTNILNEMLLMEMGVCEHLLLSTNGKKALDLLKNRIEQKEELPELILLDINMPVMDGFEFMEAYHQLPLPAHAPLLVVLTTSLNAKDMERIQRCGAADLLHKPLSRQSLQSFFNKHFA